MTPLYQGDCCDGLCGLYSVVNAIRLAMARKRPLSDKEVAALLRAGLRFIETRRGLTASLTGGMQQTLWCRLADALVAYVFRLTDVPLFVEQPFRDGPLMTRDQAFLIIEGMIVRQKATMLLRRGAHYTIISGFTATSFSLFDSAGGSWVMKTSCGVNGDSPRTRHQFCPASITAIFT